MQKGLGNMFISAAILLGFFVIVDCMGWMIARATIHTNNIQGEGKRGNEKNERQFNRDELTACIRENKVD